MNPANPTPSHSIQMQERVFAMDVKFPVCVIGTADNNITVYDLRNPTQPFQGPIPCQLAHQLRTLSLFPDQAGFAVGSVEGRVGITYFQDTTKALAFRYTSRSLTIYLTPLVLASQSSHTASQVSSRAGAREKQ